MATTPAMVKELRERTGAGMMECKKALDAVQGDLEAAVDALRASGQAKAAKRAGRAASEGVLIIKLDKSEKEGSLVEVNCETDFVARSEQFKEFADAVAVAALKAKENSIESLLEKQIDGQKTIEEARQELISKVGENIQVRRVAFLQSNGIIGQYLHGSRIGVLLNLDRHEPALAKDIAMHIAASNPLAINADHVPAEFIQREREIFIAQSNESGKPSHIIEKMVNGRIAKFLKEICLIDQPFIKDPEKTIADLLKAKQVNILAYVRFEVGEGVEKQTQDIAEK